MGLQKHYLRYGRTARDHILGLVGGGRGNSGVSKSGSGSGKPKIPNRSTPLSMLISQGAKINNMLDKMSLKQKTHLRLLTTLLAFICKILTIGRIATKTKDVDASDVHSGMIADVLTCETCDKTFIVFSNVTPETQSNKIYKDRLAVIIIGIVTLILGIILSSIPWLDYFILKNLRLWNNTLSFHYWQRPGVIRLTKVYIYNVTNPDGFLMGEKPRLQEVGPFVYREDMEKVNVKFYDNFTVSYQHKKILQFVPELSIDKNTPIVTPNIPLLTLTSLSPKLGFLLSKTISVVLTAAKFKPFINVTADQLVFGYDDALVSLAHKFYPKNMRPMARMGLLIGRNGTLTEVSTIKTGHSGMHEFGYIDRLNGLDHLPNWSEPPCNSITGSEGSFFPPRDITNSDWVYVYDKDLCRVIPLKYEKRVQKDGIDADLYYMPDNTFGDSDNNPDNQCFDSNDYEAIQGLQNISPCQFGAPVYISNAHFYQADPALLDSVEGLSPNRAVHESYFKIQPKLGVPLEGKVRIQLNLKVTQAKDIYPVKDFRDFMFPVMWLEEGVSELTPAIRRWIYLATVFAPNIIPVVSYLMIVSGAFAIIFTFVRAYQNFVFARDPTLEILEMGRRSLRRGSSFIAQHQHKFMHRESYTLLKTMPGSMNDDREDVIPIIDS